MKKILFLFLILICSNIFASIDISNNWKYHFEGEDSWSQKNRVPITVVDKKNRPLILEKEVIFKNEILENQVINLGKIDDEDEVYFNNIKIGETKTKYYSKYNYRSYYNIDRTYLIPKKLIKKKNIIKIVVYNMINDYGLRADKIYIEDETDFFNNELINYKSRINLKDMIYFVLMGVFFALFIKYIIEFLVDKREKSDLYLSIIMLLLMITSFLRLPERDYVSALTSYFYSKTDFIVPVLLMMGIDIYLFEFFKIKQYKIIRIVIWSLNIVTLSLLIFVKDIKTMIMIFSNWNILLILILGIYSFILLKMKDKNFEMQIAILGFMLWILTIFIDILSFQKILVIFNSYINIYGYFIFGITIIIGKSKNHYYLKKIEEKYKKNLEEEVERRTGEIRKANKKIIENLEKLREKDKQLIKSEKLATIGEMAGQITHEIKNPLGAILTNVQLLKLDMEDIKEVETKEELEESVIIIEKATKQAREIIVNMLDYVRGTGDKKVIDLNHSIKSAIAILKKDFEKSNVVIETEFEKDLQILAKSGEIIQVILNILLNAKDAILEKNKKGGKIIIKNYKKDDSVILEISDNGIGMSDEIKEKMFEQYFTTKEEGQGTGIGMAVTKIILDNHNAKVKIESEYGEGTKFVIEFEKIMDN
ncbi:sensor histidine kinase [Haliovirga abyssi]|uniref:histidine kinase n=1 Tax=Haliovirga abyssi TaxID=2996794 RepID=A0AAU9D1N9_9FUSO|nr:HAMP domain-containing sensor histidine kinase [Haliovirga abyssi]BDU49916.1 hypothetical protein HLVA_04850 [Haliovirga abyssi]